MSLPRAQEQEQTTEVVPMGGGGGGGGLCCRGPQRGKAMRAVGGDRGEASGLF